MGQRLNFEIVSGDTVLANAYYHWGAYSQSAAEIAAIISDYTMFEENNITKFPVGYAAYLLEQTGAGIDVDERQRVLDYEKYEDLRKFEIQCARNRNTGLLSITKEGIDETRYYEEGRVTYDINSDTFSFDLYMVWDPEDYYRDFELDPATQLEEIDLNFNEIRDMYDLLDIINNNPCGFKDRAGNIITWIT